jgi:hypothetical protein
VTRPGAARRVVLDTSAVLAYAAGSMHEPVLVAGEDGDYVAVPMMCLIEAARRDPAVDLCELLHAGQVVTVVPDRHTDAGLIAD